jgi:hypothetical protein
MELLEDGLISLLILTLCGKQQSVLILKFVNKMNIIPDPFVPVLANICHINCLGCSKWYEVVYHDKHKWRSYANSKTFTDGERLVEWKYAEDCFAD